MKLTKAKSSLRKELGREPSIEEIAQRMECGKRKVCMLPVHECVYMPLWMYGWMDGWMDGWMCADVVMDSILEIHSRNPPMFM
jgi:hypothetical protein